MAAQDSGRKIARLVKKEGEQELVETLNRMVQEAKETQQRGLEVASTFDGKKSAIQLEAREAKQKATEMMETYLDADSDALDGLEFLTMAEAAELGHVRILGEFGRSAGNGEVRQLVELVLPIQERHFEETMQGSLKLASGEDPNEAA